LAVEDMAVVHQAATSLSEMMDYVKQIAALKVFPLSLAWKIFLYNFDEICPCCEDCRGAGETTGANCATCKGDGLLTPFPAPIF